MPPSTRPPIPPAPEHLTSTRSQTALLCASLRQTGPSRTPRLRASTPAPRPSRSTHPRDLEAHTLGAPAHARPLGEGWHRGGRLAPRREAGTARSAGGAAAGAEEARPLARSVVALADPEQPCGRDRAAGGPPRAPPAKPSRPHLYAPHRCRRRSRRGPPYPPWPRHICRCLGGGLRRGFFTARNRRNATVSQRLATRLLPFCDLVFPEHQEPKRVDPYTFAWRTKPAHSSVAALIGGDWVEWAVLGRRASDCGKPARAQA